MTNRNSLAVALLPLGGSGLPTICDQNSLTPTSLANKQPLLSNQYDYDEYEIIHIDDNDDRDNNDHENMVGLSISINSRHSLFIG